MKTLKTISISLLSFAVVSGYALQSQSHKDENVGQIAQYIDQLAVSDGFSGAILIAKDNQILLKKTYGLAHIGHQVKNNEDTKFYYASIGKTFTSVAIFQLLQQGKLKLSDTVGKFLPDYPNDTLRNTVTIKQLLTHTSGVPNYFGAKSYLDGSKDRFRSMADLSPLYENLPMEAEAGGDFSYRNTNYILLGRILEQITGQPYDAYIQQYIFELAKMKNTGNFDIDHPIENAAEGYMLSDIHPGKYQLNVHMGPVRGSAAGGGYSTVGDLFNFSQALRKGQLLNKEFTDYILTPPTLDSSYGYGVSFTNPEEGTVYGHSGGFFGVGCEWRFFSEEGYTVVILTNRDQDQGFLEVRFFVQQLLDKSTPTIEKYFFSKEIVETYSKKGMDEAEKLIDGNMQLVSEMDLLLLGYNFLKRGQMKKAIATFELGVYAFPNSYNTYDSLGEAHMKNGDTQLAIKNYKRSLELDPSNQNGIDMLTKLGTR